MAATTVGKGDPQGAFLYSLREIWALNLALRVSLTLLTTKEICRRASIRGQGQFLQRKIQTEVSASQSCWSHPGLSATHRSRFCTHKNQKINTEEHGRVQKSSCALTALPPAGVSPGREGEPSPRVTLHSQHPWWHKGASKWDRVFSCVSSSDEGRPAHSEEEPGHRQP